MIHCVGGTCSKKFVSIGTPGLLSQHWYAEIGSAAG
jgi:hypothetical protein